MFIFRKIFNMRIIYLCICTILAGISSTSISQTMQVQFCGKTTNVTPVKDNGGNDQRHKGGIRMDLIRVGKLTLSRTNPIYSLGISPLSFQNGTWVDGCNTNGNQTYCSGCTTCKPILSTSSSVVGVAEGLMRENIRMRTNNNDLFIESTGTQAVVCLTTNPIDVSNEVGKKLEVNVIYEGTTLDGFTTANIHANYRFNTGPWVNLFNQNSNFLRVIDTAIGIFTNVPTDVEDLKEILSFEIIPNPVNDLLNLNLTSNKSFESNLVIFNTEGKIVSEHPQQIRQGNNTIQIFTNNLSKGLYVIQLADKSGKIKSKKFLKE